MGGVVCVALGLGLAAPWERDHGLREVAMQAALWAEGAGDVVGASEVAVSQS